MSICCKWNAVNKILTGILSVKRILLQDEMVIRFIYIYIYNLCLYSWLSLKCAYFSHFGDEKVFNSVKNEDLRFLSVCENHVIFFGTI